MRWERAQPLRAPLAHFISRKSPGFELYSVQRGGSGEYRLLASCAQFRAPQARCGRFPFSLLPPALAYPLHPPGIPSSHHSHATACSCLAGFSQSCRMLSSTWCQVEGPIWHCSWHGLGWKCPCHIAVSGFGSAASGAGAVQH